MSRGAFRRLLLSHRAGLDQLHASLTRGYPAAVLQAIAEQGIETAERRFGRRDARVVARTAAAVIRSEIVAAEHEQVLSERREGGKG